MNFAINPFGAVTYAWLMREMRFELAAEYLVMAATLVSLVIGVANTGGVIPVIFVKSSASPFGFLKPFQAALSLRARASVRACNNRAAWITGGYRSGRRLFPQSRRACA